MIKNTQQDERTGDPETEDTDRIGQIRRSCASQRNRAPEQPQRRSRQHRGRMGHLPQFLRRRTLHFPAQDHAHQLLHLRLCLLHQPCQQRHSPGHSLGLRTRGSHHRVLPPQLHRRTFPQLRRGTQSRLHHGTPGTRGQRPARGTPLQRIYPPQEHSRSQRGTGAPGRTLCRPPQCQSGNPYGKESQAAGSRERHQSVYKPMLYIQQAPSKVPRNGRNTAMPPALPPPDKAPR